MIRIKSWKEKQDTNTNILIYGNSTFWIAHSGKRWGSFGWQAEVKWEKNLTINVSTIFFICGFVLEFIVLIWLALVPCVIL